jgi:hypothetical protein
MGLSFVFCKLEQKPHLSSRTVVRVKCGDIGGVLSKVHGTEKVSTCCPAVKLCCILAPKHLVSEAQV